MARNVEENKPRDSRELVEAIRRLAWRGKKLSSPQPTVSVTPGCAFGAVVEQQLKDMGQEIDELKGRVNGLIFLVLGAVVVEIVMRLL